MRSLECRIVRSSVIRIGRFSVLLLLLFAPGLLWVEEDLSTWTDEQLQKEKDWLEALISTLNADLEAYDAFIAAMTGGKIGGDMPTYGDP